jgi:uncharacterized membrane protein YhhN
MFPLAPILTTALGVITLVPYIYFRVKKQLVPGIILKTVCSIFFLLTAFGVAFADAFNDSGLPESPFTGRFPLYAGVILGLVFGMLGDIWLDFKDIHTESHDTFQFAGFISFLIGHLFFIAGLLATWRPKPIWLLISVGAGLLVGGGAVLLEKPMKMQYGKFKVISGIYGFFLAFMAATAFICAFAGRDAVYANIDIFRQPLVMGIGGVLFLLSDLILSGTYFGENKKRPGDYIANYSLYYAAQFVIAMSLLGLD